MHFVLTYADGCRYILRLSTFYIVMLGAKTVPFIFWNEIQLYFIHAGIANCHHSTLNKSSWIETNYVFWTARYEFCYLVFWMRIHTWIRVQVKPTLPLRIVVKRLVVLIFHFACCIGSRKIDIPYKFHLEIVAINPIFFFPRKQNGV